MDRIDPRERARIGVCGTRAMTYHVSEGYRVRCATCDAGGTVKHPTREAAGAAMVRDSNKPCQTCGAR